MSEGRTALGDRTCALGDDSAGRSAWGLPPVEVRERLAAGFGRLLARERQARRMSRRGLARRALVAHSSVARLERGERRPRPVMVKALAVGLDPGDPEPVRERLLAAAGADLAGDTEQGLRRRRRVETQAWRDGRHPLPPELARRIAAADRLDAAFGMWFELVTNLDPHDGDQLDQALALGERLRLAEGELDHVGGPVLTSFGRPDGQLRLRGVGVAHLWP